MLGRWLKKPHRDRAMPRQPSCSALLPTAWTHGEEVGEASEDSRPQALSHPSFCQVQQRRESLARPVRNVSAVVVFKFVMGCNADLDGWNSTLRGLSSFCMEDAGRDFSKGERTLTEQVLGRPDSQH